MSAETVISWSPEHGPLFSAHQEGDRDARLGTLVAPGVHSSALDDRVACLERHRFPAVEDKIHFPRDDYDDVDRRRPMHPWVVRIATITLLRVHVIEHGIGPGRQLARHLACGARANR